MDVSNPRSRIGGSRAGQVLASRRGALSVAVIAALAAGALFYLFVSQYHNSSATTIVTGPQYVFVAEKYIPQGTPESQVASEGLLKRVELSSRDVVAGAIADPAEITNEAATANIAAGQQITVADFTHATVSLASYLAGDQRAIAIPFDSAHGLTSYIAEGSTVDVSVTKGAGTTMLVQDVTVLANTAGDVVLRVTDKQALTLANASDSAKLWLTLRPSIGAQSSVPLGASGVA